MAHAPIHFAPSYVPTPKPEGRELATASPPPEAVPPRAWDASEELGTVLVRSLDGASLAEARLRPRETARCANALLLHRGHFIEAFAVDRSEGFRVFGAHVSHAMLRPPVIIESEGIALELVRAPLLGHGDDQTSPLPGLVGDSPAMRRLAARVRRYATVTLPVLLRGESGTGKDLVARSLHDLGARSRGPFVVINAATISRELAESELFGHQRGAFTGASSERRGAFREAHGGTLLIDEIAALAPEVQAKLLRVVEDGLVRPLGGEVQHPVDVRLVVATCEPLEEMVEQSRFREDLYERLAVCVVNVPSLHERPEDIPALAAHLLRSSGLGHALTPQALHVLMMRRYRGNVRELRNLLVQAALRTSHDLVDAEHLRAVIEERAAARRRVSPAEALCLLEACDGNVSAAARHAKLPRSTLRDLLRKNHIDDAVVSSIQLRGG